MRWSAAHVRWRRHSVCMRWARNPWYSTRSTRVRCVRSWRTASRTRSFMRRPRSRICVSGGTSTGLSRRPTGWAIYNSADGERAPFREGLRVWADALGAKPPRHVPVWLARLLAGDVAVLMGTDARAAANAKAKRELGWTLQYPSWRQGFGA